MRRAANSWRIEIRLPGSVRPLVHDDRRLVVAGRRGHTVTRDRDEPRLVAVVVSHVGRDHFEAVELAGQRWRDRRRTGRVLLTDRLRRLCGGVRRDELDLGQLSGEELVALGGRNRDRDDPPDVAQRGARRRKQAQLHVEHDLALDQQVVREREPVDRHVDRALDRVLDRDEAEIDLSRLRRHEHIADRRDRHQLAEGEVGLREQRLLREGAERSEEPDAERGLTT